jgi:hypothetical protein
VGGDWFAGHDLCFLGGEYVPLWFTFLRRIVKVQKRLLIAAFFSLSLLVIF